MIRLIAAMTTDGIIAVNGDLPCVLKDDLKFFQRTTHGRTVVMGRKTYDTLGKALPNRHNLVLTRDAWTRQGEKDVLYLNTQMMKVFDDYDVIGGAEIYRWSLENDLVDELILTIVDYDVPEGVITRFPMECLRNFDLFKSETLYNHPHIDERNDAPFSIYKFKRK